MYSWLKHWSCQLFVTTCNVNFNDCYSPDYLGKTTFSVTSTLTTIATTRFRIYPDHWTKTLSWQRSHWNLLLKFTDWKGVKLLSYCSNVSWCKVHVEFVLLFTVHNPANFFLNSQTQIDCISNRSTRALL